MTTRPLTAKGTLPLKRENESSLYKSSKSYRWRLLLSLSLINGLYIVTGFLLNFKEVSRFAFDCCEIQQPFLGTDTLTYDIWSFTMLLSEPMLRPLVTLGFYFKYISKVPKLDKYGRRTYRT